MRDAMVLRPSYWASVSGGKDSLYMLKLILENRDEFPLDGVVHFELEIDYPFIHDVIDYMESECNKYGIKFVRIKPRKSWDEIYHRINKKTGNIYGFPTRKARWCNAQYKLDAKRQLEEYLTTQGKYLICYIGLCADESKRFKEGNVIYPLAIKGINEDVILEWAKTQPIFNNYYKTNKRCGCMYCPLSNKLNMAYLYKYYPENFEFMISKMRETEMFRERVRKTIFSNLFKPKVQCRLS